jgi:hypothetical protein
MLVLPVRIELTTSALPRMRSTTELRQQGTSMLVPKARERPGKGAYGQACAQGQGSIMAKDDTERQARMAEALRANLRRRKAQAREQQPEQPADPKAAPSRP